MQHVAVVIDQQCDRPLSIFAEGVRLVSLRFLPMRKSRVSINGSAQLLHCEFDNSSVWVGPNAHFIMRHSRIREVEDIGLLLLPNTQSLLENSVIDGATIGLSAFLSDQTDTIAAVVTHCRIGNCSQAGISATGRSVLARCQTTCLPKYMERTAFLATAWRLGRYYRTYPAYVEDDVKASLDDPHAQFRRGPLTLSARGTATDDTPAFTVQDGRYLSARWPGDAYLFARRFGALLKPTS